LVLKTNYNKNFQASLDRIDSNKGYIKGNIRYISVSVNWLKNNLDDNHLREFIQICNGSKLIF
jgi:myo-inositol catabolism protein IolC